MINMKVGGYACVCIHIYGTCFCEKCAYLLDKYVLREIFQNTNMGFNPPEFLSQV